MPQLHKHFNEGRTYNMGVCNLVADGSGREQFFNKALYVYQSEDNSVADTTCPVNGIANTLTMYAMSKDLKH